MVWQPWSSSIRFLRALLVLGALSSLLPAPAVAQIGGAANIAGTISDDSGAALPGVTVTITNTATGRTQALVTGPDGRYRAVALQPGPYEVASELQGFATVRRTISLVVGADATLDLTLGVATLTETVTVVGEAPLVEATRSQPSSVITGVQLQALPVLSRDFLVLAQLLPGAAPISRASTTQPRQGTTRFGGAADPRYAYTTQIDGGDVDDAIWGSPTISLGQDAIAEFKVFRNQFDAQYGRATTAVVAVVTKSGTNRMGGSGYYFGRDRSLNARNAFARDVPPFRQTRIGYSFGGPLALNRTHFFSAYEGLFRNTADIVALPATNPFASVENGTYPRTVRRRNALERLDHRFSDRHNAYVRYAYDFYGDFAPRKPLRQLDGGLLALGSPDFDDESRSHSIVVEENWIMSSTRVNTFRAHGLIHDLVAPTVFRGPRVIRPSLTWGQAVNSPQWFPRKRLTLTDAFLISKGKHDLNIGGEFAYSHNGFDSHRLDTGQWTFQTDAPFDRTNPATYPFQFTIREPGFYWHNGAQIGAYVSDTFRVHPRWTLNLGLRWDFDTNLRDNDITDGMLADPRFRGMERFVKSGTERGLQYDAIQPRLGATWDVRGDGTLVARGGYGIYVTRNREWYSVGTSQETNFGNTILITDRTKQGQCYPDINCVLDGRSIAEFLATSGSGLRALSLVADNYRFPYQRTASAGIGWQVTRTTGVDVDVIHSHMPNAIAGEDRNLPAAGAITATNPRPLSSLGRVTVQNLPNSRSWYDALEMQVRQRVRGANNLQLSYTLSRSMIDGCSGVCAGTLRAFARESLARLAATGRSLEHGYNPSDNRHNLAISASFELPAGVQVSGIARVVSASPITNTCACDLDGDGVNDRAPGVPPTVGRGNLQAQLDAINRYRASLNLAPFDLDRLKVLPPAKNIDIRVTKGLTLGGARRVELFAEAFNITNVVNLTGGNGNVRLATFKVPDGAQEARQVQWGARYSF
ncbi:MAG: TonB-dependent receptor [Acidimicrobiia bacterium]|nr:TonB-dependent receptor [Acidimicrobiia bacterium]